jgi:hypothetical protein
MLNLHEFTFYSDGAIMIVTFIVVHN